MYPHRIRLRGPWECEPVGRLVQRDGVPCFAADQLPMARRVIMPCRWAEAGLADFAGQVRLRRHFGYPGRIDADERVWLTLAGLSDVAALSLNGQSLGSVGELDCPWECDITTLLRPRNELIVLLESSNDRGGLWGDVALEIRRTAFLQKVQACRTEVAGSPCLMVSGLVVGKSERPLELYALLGGKTIAYATTEPRSEGNRFELMIRAESNGAFDAPTQPLRLELIDGAVVWYVVEVSIS